VIVAVDPGAAHCGVAVSDDDETQADCIGSILSQTFEDYYRGVVAFPTGKKRLDHE
jgi:RNase H-fold protein (predicted Holliday junction resolvase)